MVPAENVFIAVQSKNNFLKTYYSNDNEETWAITNALQFAWNKWLVSFIHKYLFRY